MIIYNFVNKLFIKWRRERDSNPRNGFPFTRFPSVRLQPLGHLSLVIRRVSGGVIKEFKDYHSLNL